MARSQGAEPGPPADAGFAERLLELMNSGRRTATYKLTLLMALLDLCARRGDTPGRPPRVPASCRGEQRRLGKPWSASGWTASTRRCCTAWRWR